VGVPNWNWPRQIAMAKETAMKTTVGFGWRMAI
jgi:hypothetical protein